MNFSAKAEANGLCLGYGRLRLTPYSTHHDRQTEGIRGAVGRSLYRCPKEVEEKTRQAEGERERARKARLASERGAVEEKPARGLLKEGLLVKVKSGRRLRAVLCTDILILVEEIAKAMYRNPMPISDVAIHELQAVEVGDRMSLA